MYDELKDLENEFVHYELKLAKEKFRLFAFRWKIMNKVNKMKIFDRDSVEYMKCSLEI